MKQDLYMSFSAKNIGILGERIAAKYLENKGFFIVSRNYRKTYGEIDLIAKKGEGLHFIEVKSVSRETLLSPEDTKGGYRPEENVHPQKMRRLANTIQAYLSSECGEGEPNWQFHVITVEIDVKGKRARCFWLKDVIL